LRNLERVMGIESPHHQTLFHQSLSQETGLKKRYLKRYLSVADRQATEQRNRQWVPSYGSDVEDTAAKAPSDGSTLTQYLAGDSPATVSAPVDLAGDHAVRSTNMPEMRPDAQNGTCVKCKRCLDTASP
jgi:hypothetical protein